MGLGQWVRWSNSHQEGWRWLKEDQRVLGLHPRGGSAGGDDIINKLVELHIISHQLDTNI